MTAKHLHAALLSIAVGLGGISMSQQAFAADGQVQNNQQRTTDSPTALVQAFVDTMDYQYLSDEDKAVWDEQTWDQIQQRSVHANQTRLPQGHEFYELESFVRQLVEIEAIAYEHADDGSIRVTAKTTYPNLLILVDDYADTRSSAVYDQLAEYQVQFESGDLTVDSISVYQSEMPWRVHNSGVYVNAAKMQQNKETRQARSDW